MPRPRRGSGRSGASRRRRPSTAPDAPVQENAAPVQEAAVEVVPETPPPNPGADTVLDALENMVSAVVSGNVFPDSDRETVARLIHEQERRAEIITSLLMTHDQERLVRFLRMRKKLESQLEEALASNQLSNADKAAFLDYINAEARHMENNVKAGAVGLKDVIGLLTKLDYSLSQGNAALQQRLAATSPQAREVVRKLAYRVARSASAAAATDVPDSE